MKLVPLIQRLLGRIQPVPGDPDAALRAWALAKADRQAARLRALDIQIQVQTGRRH